VRPIVEALLDAGESTVPGHLREGIEARVASAAGADAEEWAVARGTRSVAARACGEPVGAGASRGGDASGGPELTIVRESEGRWCPSGIRGVRFRTLCADRRANRRTIELRMDPGTELPDHDHAGMEEVYVVSGDLWIGKERLGPGDYFRVGVGAEHGTPRTEGGCVCIIVSEYVPYSVKSLPRFAWTAIRALFGQKQE
jgi:quercetin dioxygenase-like cupin family protein